VRHTVKKTQQPKTLKELGVEQPKEQPKEQRAEVHFQSLSYEKLLGTSESGNE
jgi:hypothetical protein